MGARATASIIIIGDEILNGDTQDTNSHFLCRELYKCGVRVARISVIPDDVEVIAEEVLEHSKKYSFVLTSGGIGPTHDDVTYEGVARAFNEKLVHNKDLQSILSQFCLNLGLEESAAFEMSRVPESAEIHTTGNSRIFSVPILSVKNVFIFPGIPSYLEYGFVKLKPIFSMSSKPYFTRNLYVSVSEFDITGILNGAVKEFEQDVKFGSYPVLDNDLYQVKLTLEADFEDAITAAEAYLRSHLPQNSVVGPHTPASEESYGLLLNLLNDNPSENELAKVIKDSLSAIEEAFHKYPIHTTCLSFNGGKDCTVLLHLIHLFLFKKFSKKIPKFKALYVTSQESFPEIEEFVNISVQRYNLELITYGKPIKEALHKLEVEHPRIKAIFMGTRRTDPHGSEIQTFQTTDSDWPQFVRINLLTEWTYAQVWTFLRLLEVPYCGLYDRGYTSVGCKHNTTPNDTLLAKTKDGELYYRPAYLLKDETLEREGRCSL